jgi:cytochrome P450
MPVGKMYHHPRLDLFDGKFLGDGIFNSDGQVWSTSRALLRPQFQKQRISELETFQFHTNKLLSLIPPNGETFDIMDLWYRFTLDASTEFLFGQSVNSLDNPKVRINPK